MENCPVRLLSHLHPTCAPPGTRAARPRFAVPRRPHRPQFAAPRRLHRPRLPPETMRAAPLDSPAWPPKKNLSLRKLFFRERRPRGLNATQWQSVSESAERDPYYSRRHTDGTPTAHRRQRGAPPVSSPTDPRRISDGSPTDLGTPPVPPPTVGRRSTDGRRYHQGTKKAPLRALSYGREPNS